MRDLVNLVIRCTGCKIEVEAQDIEDPDNVVSKLTDVQDEFQAQKITDYPLISKAKGNASFRSTMTGFFETLINTCHASGLLYSDVALYENLELWVSTMSSSIIRPFRHTATVIALSMGSALCTVANDLAESAAKFTRQKEGEQKKKSVNKERVRALEAKIADQGRKRTSIIDNVQQLFDQVYVHRYRDVDPRIRVDCVSALGFWINTLPDHFFEGIYLRYLSWVSALCYPFHPGHSGHTSRMMFHGLTAACWFEKCTSCTFYGKHTDCLSKRYCQTRSRPREQKSSNSSSSCSRTKIILPDYEHLQKSFALGWWKCRFVIQK